MKNVTLIYPSRDQMAGTIWDFRHLLGLIKDKSRVIAISTLSKPAIRLSRKCHTAQAYCRLIVP